ncbi:putative GTP binding protein (Bud4) [Aspergillus ruber CBS 135680]|uniref:DUF1709-domain-containing protein n=1 Tax=Aspergillus ruber (strain CBS 135680) TaxID=1388766 RepID=A0A017S454_ASPRC|nr:DUF1709-domain-containing protein [Aspergillus ruber CBS 135680]EYE91732.1 DUF1709-domain-containing protein [Aspergillus ruber CBS 135680]
MPNGAVQRPLSEVSPVAQRRNSPSWNPNTKQMLKNNSPDKPASLRLYWQGRDSSEKSENQAPYDPDAPNKPSKRPSVENLKRVARVRNSHIFRDRNSEYDASQVDVPQRPLSTNSSPQKQQTGPQTNNSIESPRPPSPAKSSLSKASRFGVKGGFDPEYEIWSDADGHRHAKSVTFDAAPPQVNEYEMTTPDPSVSAASDSRDGSYDSEEEAEEDEGDVSFERESSAEHDDSFDASLEDTEKTPVVLPEEWRYGHEDEDESFTEDEDEDASHSPDPRPSPHQEPSRPHSRVESLDSNGEPRPLPPLPSVMRSQANQSSPGKFTTTALELGSGGQRTLPSPPGPATYSKSDITGFKNSSMSLEDRLRLMMIQDEKKDEKQPEHSEPVQEPAKADNGQHDGIEDELKQQENVEPKEETDDAAKEPDVFTPPRISRDSILRDLRKGDDFYDDDDDDSYLDYDPDVPLPSLEGDDDGEYDTDSVIIKEEDNSELSDIPEHCESASSKDPSMKDLQGKLPHNGSSNYSLHSAGAANTHSPPAEEPEDRSSTPVPAPAEPGKQMEYQGHLDHNEHRDPTEPTEPTEPTDETQEAPEKESSVDAQNEREKARPFSAFDIRPASALDVRPESALDSRPVSALDMASIRETLQRPGTPEPNGSPVSEPSTPDSVIRHPIEDDDMSDFSPDGSVTDESVPDPIATIKAPGTGLKTRPSLTPADLEQMAATRRKVSGPQAFRLPSLSKHFSNDSQHSNNDDEAQEPEDDSNKLAPPSPSKDTQRQSSLVKLDIPFSIQEESLGFGLNREFDRVMENQKRGYLMRQNTKVIVASSHNEEETATTPGEAATEARLSRVPGNSNRKPSQQTWTTVPWNSQRRRSSIRTPSGLKKKPVPGAVPPLPGQSSNVDAAAADEPGLNEALDEGEERGRLFVKVVGLKYLDLPMPRGERSYFALTLDNGLHCVTTAWLELGKSAPIGQEFELIVHNDLEFQLTLQMKVDEEKMKAPEVAPPSPAKQKASTFSRVFASPRKRKELEMKQQLVSQQRKSQDVNAGVWDRLRTLIAQDGSFGRAYVALSDHEKHAFGRPYTVDIACFNEWAVEEQPSSIKSKKSTSSNSSQRRPPYKIGKLEVQLLFVPKPKGAKDEDMPKSMNSCIREMREAESVSTRTFEGFLSQQGGDCPYWRRRFFKVVGSKLTAYHETTRQPRATINLSKAVKLIDDRSSLTQRETSTRGGGRRKSAFAEEEEGYMFVEEGFRIRFGNGEVIDFYADSAAEKDGWMKVLADSVGKGTSSSGSVAKPWTDVVLRRERSMKARRQPSGTHGPPLPTQAPPVPPVKSDVGAPPSTSAGVPAPASVPSKPRHKHTQSQPETRGFDARRAKTRSLIF